MHRADLTYAARPENPPVVGLVANTFHYEADQAGHAEMVRKRRLDQEHYAQEHFERVMGRPILPSAPRSARQSALTEAAAELAELLQ